LPFIVSDNSLSVG